MEGGACGGWGVEGGAWSASATTLETECHVPRSQVIIDNWTAIKGKFYLPVLALVPERNSFLVVSTLTLAAASTMEPPAVRWGIIGLGDVTAVKSGPPFWKCRGSELVAVFRRTPGAAHKWAKAYAPSGCTGYENIDDFLAHPGLDAIYIATPPGGHLETALKVAAAGKHCYVEKPVGRSGRETAAIVSAFEAKGLTLFTAYVSRAYERTDAVRALLAEGAIGDRVTSVTYTLRGQGGARGMEGAALPWRLDAAQSGGGLVMDVGCHVIDRIDYLLGPLSGVTGSASNRNSPNQQVEDYVEVRATIGPSVSAAVASMGAPVACTWEFAPREDGAAPVDELLICGPNGSLQMAAMSPDAPVTVLDADGAVVRRMSFDAPEHAAQRLIQSATDELRGVRGVKCRSRAENALRASRVLDVALGGYYGGREDDYWSRPDTWPGRKL